MTISRNIHFGTAKLIPSLSNRVILRALRKVINLYWLRGLQVRLLLGDGQFKSMRAAIADMRVQLNITGKDEHVGDIEQHIQTVKERTRAIYNTLPFALMPRRLVIKMVLASIF